MKKTWIAAAALLLLSVAAFAQSPSPAPISDVALAQILAAPGTGACPTDAPQPVLAAQKPLQLKALCSATAVCATGTVSCNGNNSATSCAAFDRSCPGERGHVVCDGVTTNCPTACPATCSTGTPRQRACCRCAESGGCADCQFCEYGYYIPNTCP